MQPLPQWRIVQGLAGLAAAVLTLAVAAAQPAQPPALPVEIVVPQYHSALVIPSLSLSPDQRFLASAGNDDGTIKLWNAGSLALIRTIRTGRGQVWWVHALPDSRTVVARSGAGVDLWDAVTGRLVRNHPLARSEYAPTAASADGRTLATLDGPDLVVMDSESGRELSRFGVPREQVHAVAVSPDGRVLAYGGENGRTTVREIAGRTIATFDHPRLAIVGAVAFSRDGRALAVADGGTRQQPDRRTVATWELQGGIASARVWEEAGEGPSLAWSPDGQAITGAGEGRRDIGVRDARSGGLVRKLGFPREALGFRAVVFSPDGRHLYATETGGAIWRWDLLNGTPLASIAPDRYAHIAAFAGDQVVLAESEFDSEAPLAFHQLDVRAGALSRSFEINASLDSLSCDRAVSLASSGPDELSRRLTLIRDVGKASSDRAGPPPDDLRRHNAMMLSSDARRAAIAPSFWIPFKMLNVDHPIRRAPVELWDAERQQILHRLPGHNGPARALCFSADGRMLATGGEDRTIRLWDVASGRALWTVAAHQVAVGQIGFTRDGAALVSWGGRFVHDPVTGRSATDDTVKVWDVATGRLVSELEGAKGPFSLSPDGRHLAAGRDATTVWDTATWRRLHAVAGEQRGFTPDGRLLVTTSTRLERSGHSVRLWDVAAGGLVRSLEGHQVDVDGAVVSADNRLAASQSADGLVKLWRIETGAELASVFVAGPDAWVVVTPEGFFNASPKGTALISVVRGLDVLSVDQVYQVLYRPDLVREKLAGDPRGLVRDAAARLDLDKVIASGSPPRISLSAATTEVSAGQAEVTATLSDSGGGIGKLEWRVNGVTLGVETRGFDRIAGPAAPVVVTRSLQLTPGENVIEVVAYNAAGLIASSPARLVLTRAAVAPAGKPRLHVLTVGVNDYLDGRLRLTFATVDARAVGEAMRRAGGDLYESVEVITILDEGVTAASLDRSFAALAAKVRPDDVFVFFLAGHGKTVDGRYHFLPQDFRYAGDESIVARGIGQEQWQEWFARIAARKSLLLYDTCESGSLTGERVATRGIERLAAVERLTRATGRTTLTAATDDAPALEGYRGHGVFTYALLDALGKADANGDGLVDVTELATFVDAQVPELSFQAFRQRQFPQMRIVGSNFPVASKAALLQAGEVAAPIETRPTHMVVTAADVFAQAGGAGRSTQKLAPGTMVTLIRTERGWALVARDGKQLGYVRQQSLLAPQ